MKRIISRLTMKRDRHLFVDCVSGLDIYLYIDKYGKEYLADYPFYFFSHRVENKFN